MESDSEQIVGLYQRHAAAWDELRSPGSLFEKPWLDKFLAVVPAGGSALDLGCGGGLPISGYLIGQGRAVTGVDSSPPLIDLCRQRFPQQEWIVADMRTVDLARRFDALIAWDSFFHLCPKDQRRMFVVFSRHAKPGAALMFTSGSHLGEAIGEFQGEPLYHGSLDPEEYENLLEQFGFELVEHVADDPGCGHHTIWLSRRRGLQTDSRRSSSGVQHADI
ncbi:MAG TPA: class I SAM-dependent methyltransferase [Acidobacteriaceae bacterium]|nr:class I SAM-dependent methyltransferase [Acidobacteriaceae bacterium]